MSGERAIDFVEDGLLGRGTASVDVDDAGLPRGEEDSGEGVKIYLLAPAPGRTGGDIKIGAGIPKDCLGAGLTDRTTGFCCLEQGCRLFADVDSNACRRGRAAAWTASSG